MSGIGAICHWDGAPLHQPVSLVARALTAMAVDGMESWTDQTCGLVHAHHWTVPEDVGTAQPLANARGNLHVVADARLDNRDELIRELRDDMRAVVPTDAQLILAAFERWGDECPARLIGDFAFVIWDASTRRLFAARDVFGSRPLFYLSRSDRYLAASTIEAVARGDGGRLGINRDVVREVARGSCARWDHETAWREIFRVPPAHSLVVQQRQLPKLNRYYVLGENHESRRLTENDWDEAFASAFRESVRARLRTQLSVTVLGGGGLDSSAVFCQAAELKQDGDVVPDLSLLSSRFDSTTLADEHAYLNAIKAARPALNIVELNCDQCFCDPVHGDPRANLWEPDVWLQPDTAASLIARAAALGSGVVLNGHGGDELLFSGGYRIPHVLHDWPTSKRLREVRHFKNGRSELALWLVFGRLLRALRPPRNPRYLPAPDLPTWAAKQSYAMLNTWLTGYPDRQAVAGAASQVEIRSPFLDIRLFNLMLGAPMQIRCSDGETKHLLRRSIGRLMPPAIRTRVGKAGFGHLGKGGLLQNRDEVAQMIERSVLGDLGLVDVKELRTQLARFDAEPSYLAANPILWFCSPERWIRKFADTL